MGFVEFCTGYLQETYGYEITFTNRIKVGVQVSVVPDWSMTVVK